MINILLSVFLFAAVKAMFLWVFAPKGQRCQRVLCRLPDSEDGVSLGASHGMTVTQADEVNQELLAFSKT